MEYRSGVNPPTYIASLERCGVKVVLMPGVGHFPMLEDPERFNRVLDDVLAPYRGEAGEGRQR